MWTPVKKSLPNQIDCESSRPVIVRYKDKTADPEVCRYNFITKKFVFGEHDVTKYVKEWTEIPE